MSVLSRLKASPGLLVRALVALSAVAAVAAGLAAFASRGVPLGADVAEEIVVLVVVGALTRPYGIALPGNGFSSYKIGRAHNSSHSQIPYAVFPLQTKKDS